MPRRTSVCTCVLSDDWESTLSEMRAFPPIHTVSQPSVSHIRKSYCISDMTHPGSRPPRATTGGHLFVRPRIPGARMPAATVAAMGLAVKFRLAATVIPMSSLYSCGACRFRQMLMVMLPLATNAYMPSGLGRLARSGIQRIMCKLVGVQNAIRTSARRHRRLAKSSSTH